MKQILLILGAAALAAFVLLRPAPVPAPVAAWTAATPPPRPGRSRATAAPRALVYVAGAVARPGVYTLASDARVKDAVALAGGMRPAADPAAVNLAAHLRDGDEVVVPLLGDPVTGRASSRGRPRRQKAAGYASRGRGRRSDGGPGSGWSRRNAAPPASQVDINTAGADVLATVPGIGPGLAARIVAFRVANGPFASADELLDVSGMTDRRLDALAPYVIAR